MQTNLRISASNAIERHNAPLDARSTVALEFVNFWCRRHGSIAPVPGATIRRALQLLADHVSSIGGDVVAHEVRAFKAAGKGEGSALSLTQARARIEDHIRAPAAQPMGHWRDALEDQNERRQSAEMLARLEALMSEGVEA